MINNLLDLSPPVAMALQEKRPVVALESTIISHGMPFPRNVETALKVEEEVEKYGAVPATVAILDGKLKVGLSRKEIARIGQEQGRVVKASRRDIPFLLAQGSMGATTVAATMFIAARAGIRIFATGGIGGVHRGGETSMDISADLQELAKTNVAVVSAGAKSILDIGRTLEYLETQGVPVIGYRTPDFPAFFSRRSGHRVDYQVDTVEELALALHTKWSLELEGGVLVANPIPREYEMDYHHVDLAIRRAIGEAEVREIHGKDITPFLLSRIEELTKGASLEANIRLVLNNARVGAKLARAFQATQE